MCDVRLQRPIRLFAPAKVNLGLEILRRRDDGYHEIVTVLQSVSLFDEIVLIPSDRLEFESDPDIPDDDNLAFRAIQLAQTRLAVSLRARVRIDKRIPIAAGLGGGSSDAGTLLAAIGLLAGVSRNQCCEVAAELGSDVPFFVDGGTALATGTGTSLEQLPSLTRQWFVIVTPTVAIPNKTATLYGNLTPDDFSDGAATRETAARLGRGEPIPSFALRNAFAHALFHVPEIEHARETMLRAGAKTVLPSGAGPSLFSPISTWSEGRDLAHRLLAAGLRCYVCTNVSAQLNLGRIPRPAA